jgi:hypothetical protein
MKYRIDEIVKFVIFHKQVFQLCGETPPDSRKPCDIFYDEMSRRLLMYTSEV